jgi:uncharacterized protein (TIGR01370 family)
LCTPARVARQLSEVRSWAFQLQNVDPLEIKLSGIASYARAHHKDFLIIPQNGDGLLGNSQFLETIDGFGREDLLYSETDAEVRNAQHSIVESIRRMRPLITAGKPILVIEYTSNRELALSMLREIKELGFVGYVASRDLKTLSPAAFGCGQPDCSQ